MNLLEEQRADDQTDKLIGQIATLRQRLLKYEPDDNADGDYAPMRPQVDKTKLELDQALKQIDSLRGELRVAEDAIREHIRQKAQLRDLIQRLQAAEATRESSPVAAVVATDSDALLCLLRARDSAVAPSFLRDFLQWRMERVTSALKPLVASGAVECVKLGEIAQFRSKRTTSCARP